MKGNMTFIPILVRMFAFKARGSFPALLIVLLCHAATFGQTPPNLARGDASTQSEEAVITHVEEDWLRALSTGNVSAIADILADDFVRPAPQAGQFIGKRDLLAWYRSHLSAQQANKKRIDDMHVTIYGATALARGMVVTTNSEGKMVAKSLFTDIFVRRGGKWRAISAQENEVASASGS